MRQQRLSTRSRKRNGIKVAELNTYDFKVYINGNVRIDATTEEEAREEFNREVAHEPVLIAPTQDQIVVVSAFAWDEPVLFVEDEEDLDG